MTRHTDPLRFRRRLAREAHWWGQPGAWCYRRPCLARRYRLAREVAYWCTLRRAGLTLA